MVVARLAGAGGHDEEGAALVGGEGLGNAADGFVLVGAVDDGLLMGVASSGSRFCRRNSRRSRSSGAKNPATRRGLARPTSQNQMVMAVGHEPERGEGLLLGDFGDVVAKLFVGLARVAGASLGFDDGEHVAAGVVEAVVGDAVPGLGVVAIDGDFKSDLGAVVEGPGGSAQGGIDEGGAGFGFAEIHRGGWGEYRPRSISTLLPFPFAGCPSLRTVCSNPSRRIVCFTHRSLPNGRLRLWSTPSAPAPWPQRRIHMRVPIPRPIHRPCPHTHQQVGQVFLARPLAHRAPALRIEFFADFYAVVIVQVGMVAHGQCRGGSCGLAHGHGRCRYAGAAGGQLCGGMASPGPPAGCSLFWSAGFSMGCRTPRASRPILFNALLGVEANRVVIGLALDGQLPPGGIEVSFGFFNPLVRAGLHRAFRPVRGFR